MHFEIFKLVWISFFFFFSLLIYNLFVCLKHSNFIFLGIIIFLLTSSKYTFIEKNKSKKIMLIMHLPGDSKAHIMRKNGCIVHIVVAMNSINSIYHRDCKTSGHSPFLKIVHCINPLLCSSLRSRDTPSTT